MKLLAEWTRQAQITGVIQELTWAVGSLQGKYHATLQRTRTHSVADWQYTDYTYSIFKYKCYTLIQVLGNHLGSNRPWS